MPDPNYLAPRDRPVAVVPYLLALAMSFDTDGDRFDMTCRAAMRACDRERVHSVANGTHECMSLPRHLRRAVKEGEYQEMMRGHR